MHGNIIIIELPKQIILLHYNYDCGTILNVITRYRYYCFYTNTYNK